MANLDQIKVRKTNTIYDLEDSTARDSINSINDKIPSGASSSDKLVKSSDLGTAAGKDSTSTIAGPKTCAELTNALLVAANKGNVYNMTDAGTTTADFKEGAGKPIRVGDNVGVYYDETESKYMFDLLSGFVDTSGFQNKTMSSPITVDGVSKATVEDALNAINNLAGDNKTAIGNVSTALSDLGFYVDSDGYVCQRIV